MKKCMRCINYLKFGNFPLIKIELSCLYSLIINATHTVSLMQGSLADKSGFTSNLELHSKKSQLNYL